MGSRLVAGALHDFNPDGNKKDVFREIVFASADFDSATFRNRYANSISCASLTRFYINPDDKALGFSAKFYGDHKRVGSPGDDIDQLTCLPQKDIQVIDFSAYGNHGGMIGHDIQFSLISNMHKYDKLDPKWKIIHQPLKIISSKGISK